AHNHARPCMPGRASAFGGCDASLVMRSIEQAERGRPVREANKVRSKVRQAWDYHSAGEFFHLANQFLNAFRTAGTSEPFQVGGRRREYREADGAGHPLQPMSKRCDLIKIG